MKIGILSTGDATYLQDSDGFLLQKTAGSDITQYWYALTGELQTVELPSGTLIDYEYDPLGRRIAKKVNGIYTEKYLWQGMTRLLAVFDASDNLLMRFEYADARMPVAMIVEGATYYLAFDQVGSLRAVVDGAGNVVKQIDYDTFGNVLFDSNPSFYVPFRFAGGLFDAHTGLIRFGYRDYDPCLGRWTSKDPIGFAGGDADLYGYCLGDPVNFVDSNGLFGFLQAAGAFLGAAVNASNNWSAYQSGQMSFGQYAGSIVFGAGTGFLSSLSPSFWGGILLGGITAGINNLHEQIIKKTCVDWGEWGATNLLGMGVGLVGGSFATVGNKFALSRGAIIGGELGKKFPSAIPLGGAAGVSGIVGATILTQ